MSEFGIKASSKEQFTISVLTGSKLGKHSVRTEAGSGSLEHSGGFSKVSYEVSRNTLKSCTFAGLGISRKVIQVKVIPNTSTVNR